MKEHFEKQLQSDFPFMQQNRDKKERNIYRRWGCECSSGWFELIYELCQRITNRYAEDGIPANEIDLEILQIKEKFGTLRFYYKFKGVSGGLQAIDFLGAASLRFEPQNCEDNEAKKKLRHDISELVRGYEKWSAHICEYCGERGVFRMDMPWKKTLCDDCYNAYLRKREEKTKS